LPLTLGDWESRLLKKAEIHGLHRTCNQARIGAYDRTALSRGEALRGMKA
jgi:hypothetical protein